MLIFVPSPTPTAPLGKSPNPSTDSIVEFSKGLTKWADAKNGKYDD